jgi:hypothetical protein
VSDSTNASAEKSRVPASRHLSQIAQARNCSEGEARQFCLEVQTLQHGPVSSFKSIAQAVMLLGADAAVAVVASEATRIHLEDLGRRPPKQRRSLKRRRGLWQSPNIPKYIIVDGVLETTSGWQKREGIRDDD